MTNKSLEYLNFAFLLFSFFIAIKIPFELFLFSYAFLGPLHYLTEINWLNDKNYFIRAKKKWSIFYIIIALIIAVNSIFSYLNVHVSEILNIEVKYVSSAINIFLLSGFFFAISLTFFSNNKQLIISLLTSFILAIIISFFLPNVLIATGVFLPTLIHVYIFTLLFMVYGVLKKTSKVAIFNIVLLAMIPLCVIFLDVRPTSYNPSDYVKNTYVESNLLALSAAVAKMVNYIQGKDFYVLSKLGIKIQIFIAFAYTYHYLNWFAKTSIIGWRKSLTRKKIKYILVFWVCFICIYFYNYKTGYMVLLFLSFLHVLLEFPLNIITIRDVLSLKKRR